MIYLLINLVFATNINCARYEINEKRPFHGPTSNGDNFRGYSIKKTSDVGFTIGFNPQFIDGEAPEKFNGCFREDSYKLKTPLGKKISIKKDLTAPQIKIKIHRGKASRTRWHINMNCLEMAHELLHWAGLCDEYKSPVFPVRRVRRNNIMAFSRAPNQYTNTLLDDQLNQFLFPDCPINEKYERCSKLAYEKSKKYSLPSDCDQFFDKKEHIETSTVSTPTPIDE